jgi:enoyl-CoA hydratase
MCAASEVEVAVADRIARITIDRPGSGNAIGLATAESLAAAIAEVRAAAPDVLVLRGAGERVFVSGGDLVELSALRSVPDATGMALRLRAVLDDLAALDCLVIAALNGHALGGGAEVALAADLRIAAEDVTIAFNQSALAIMPAWGGVERLVELVGRSRALRLMLTGERVSAREACALGLVDLVVRRAQFGAQCEELASRVAGAGPGVARAIKATVSAISPNSHPQHAGDAAGRFADLWVADPHWAAADALIAKLRAGGESAVK